MSIEYPKCKTCKYHAPDMIRTVRGDELDTVGGFCKSKKIREDWNQNKLSDECVYSYSEGGTFWTGNDFGCAHHETKPEAA